MVSRAIGRYIRIAPRKARLLADVIRGSSVEKAEALLSNTNKAAAAPIKRLLLSAISNAKRALQGKSVGLYVSTIKVDGGPMFKRFKAQAMGRATQIQKKTSHITIELERYGA